jgi:hypothetical protein
MEPIEIKKINNIADIYIIRKKIDKSLLYEAIYPFLLLVIGVCCFYMLGGGNSNFENINNTVFVGFLMKASMILFVIALILSMILRFAVTINAVNSLIDFLTSINEQQYSIKCQNLKIVYTIYWISLILVFIPPLKFVGYVICVCVACLNMYIYCSIKTKINEVESDFFSTCSKINKSFKAQNVSVLKERPWLLVLFVSFVILKIAFFSFVVNEIWKLFNC